MSLPKSLPSSRIKPASDAPVIRWGILGSGWIAEKFIESVRAHTRASGRHFEGLYYEAAEVARCISAGKLETPYRTLDVSGSSHWLTPVVGLKSLLGKPRLEPQKKLD